MIRVHRQLASAQAQRLLHIYATAFIIRSLLIAKSTGESGWWMLTGMTAGGMTALTLDKWPDYYASRLSNPYSEPANEDPASAQSIQKITTGDLQTGTVGTQLADPLQVKVFDQNQNPVKNAEVTFIVKAGGGKLGDNLATSATATTNSQGIASIKLTLGQKTSENPTFWWYDDAAKPMPDQAGENIIDATLSSGTGISTPFTAYGLPGAVTKVKKAYGDGTWGTALSFAGFVSVSVQDKYDNPVSNIPVTFTAADPVQNSDEPNCPWTTTDTRKTYLLETSESCLKDAPIWGTCGDSLRTSLTVTTDYTGAQAQVILGGMEDAKYTINATALTFTNTFTLYTYDLYALYGRSCDNTQDPLRQLKVTYTYATDQYGNNIVSGKTGSTIPVQAKIYSLVEGETLKDVSYSCSDVTHTCSKIVGNRQYETTTDYTASSVIFSGVTGTAQGNGIYTANYKLKAGVNTITIDGSGTLDVQSTTGCPACSTVTVPLAQTDTTTMTVYGVDIQFGTIPVILVDQNGYAEQDNSITYTITPQEYTAGSAYTVIYKNEEPVAYLYTEKQGTGTAIISRGFQFDLNSSYSVEVVLNSGTGMEIRSKKASLTPAIMYIEQQDPEFPDLKLRWNDYYPALGSKMVTLKGSSSLNGGTVTCEILEPTAATVGNIISMTMPTCASENPQIVNGTVKFKLTGTDLAPMANNDPTTGIDEIKLRFTVAQQPTVPTVEATYDVKNNSNVTFQEVLNGEAVFTADKDTVISTSTGSTPGAQGFDYVQELLNQIVPRKRQTYDGTTGQWVANQYVLIEVDGIYSTASYTGIRLFKRSFGFAAEASDTYNKIKKDYGLSATDANDLWWFDKIIDKEALVGKTQRIPADADAITSTNADTIPNSDSDNTAGDTGLYELYKNVVERFANKMVDEAKLYAGERQPDPGQGEQAVTDNWYARTGEGPGHHGATGMSYSYGGKMNIALFNTQVSPLCWKASEKQITGVIDSTTSVRLVEAAIPTSPYQSSPGETIVQQQYKGDLDNACNIGATNGQKYPGLKEHEYNSTETHYVMTIYSSFPQATFVLPQFGSQYWAGIDCSGLVQRSINRAEAVGLPGATSNVPALNDSGGGAVWSQDLVVNCSQCVSTYSYQIIYDSQNEVQSLANVRKGDLVGYPHHVSIVHSDKPTCVTDEDDHTTSCTYEIMHASGDNQVCYKVTDSETYCQFNRKVAVNTVNKDLQSKTLKKPMGFGRIKLWD